MPGEFSTTLANSFDGIDPSQPIPTRQFAEACGSILPIFTHLGTVFHFASQDTVAKRDDLLQCSEQLKTLTELVQADQKAGTVKVRGSHARNLDRLKNMVAFIRVLLTRLMSDANVSLKEAASGAYEQILAPTHTWAIRTTVSMGMMMLPSKEHFLEKLGEKSLEDAKPLLQKFVEQAEKIVAAVEGLYDEPIGRG